MNIRDLVGRLDSEGHHWHEQLVVIFGVGWQTFEKTWLLRFCDRWRVEAYVALGETKRKIIQNEPFNTGPGEFANWLFNKEKSASRRKAARDVSKQPEPSKHQTEWQEH